MAAKDVKFPNDARERMLRGVGILANAVKVTLGPATGQYALFDRGAGGVQSCVDAVFSFLHLNIGRAALAARHLIETACKSVL